MQYMKLNPSEREGLLSSLSDMPDFLRRSFSGLTPAQAKTAGADGSPSPVEQVWHLADLEREGFAARIARLLSEPGPYLPDFDGTRIAAERNYRARSLEDGLAAFASARQANVLALRDISGDRWFLSGTQEGVGSVSLCDIPGFMSQHDAVHRAEIETWRRERE